LALEEPPKQGNVPGQTAEGGERRWRRAYVIIALLVLGVSVGLRIWAEKELHPGRPTPAIAVWNVGFGVQVSAWDDGIHFLAVFDRGAKEPPGIYLGPKTNLGRSGYRHGRLLSFLGLQAVLLPSTYGGSDYTVTPHAALVLPYWLLIVLSGVTALRCSKGWAFVGRHLSLSVPAVVLGLIVTIVFAVLNFSPAATGSHGPIRREGVVDWISLALTRPGSSEIRLEYGFPSVCYRRGIIGGQSVDLFHGAEMGWKQHLLMEDVCIAVLAVLATIMAVEWIRGRVRGEGREPGGGDVRAP
jgi:hypothetical protein